MSRRTIIELMLMLLLANLLVLANNVVDATVMPTIHILPDGSVTPSWANITRTADIYYTVTANMNFSGDGIIVERDNIILDGAGFTIQGPGSGQVFPYPTGIFLSQRSNVTIKNFRIRAFLWGIQLHSCSGGNSIVRNSITKTNTGLYFAASFGNVIKENNITDNINYGLRLSYTAGNFIYHNNIISNDKQAITDNSANTWDNGYPSGGNHWGIGGQDLSRGPYQNENGSDGIKDSQVYISSGDSNDTYPLMDWWSPTNIAISSLLPDRNAPCNDFPLCIDTIVRSEGITIAVINITIYANTTMVGTTNLTLIGKGSTLLTMTWTISGLKEYDNYTLWVHAKPISDEINLTDNTLFYNNVVTMTHVGDVNIDKKVDIQDLSRVSAAFGSLRVNNPLDQKYAKYYHPIVCVTCPHDNRTDINGDRKVDIQDLARTSANFGWHP